MAASRYELISKLASGGMGSVFVGRVRGPLGFSRLVAIKRAHPHLVDDPLFVQMLVDEAKLASRIHHPHVVSVLDVERVKEQTPLGPKREIRLVMDYVEGLTLAELASLAEKRGFTVPPGVAVRALLDAGAGLQAAHELSDDAGTPLGIVHRDISPQNLLVGVDGMTRVSDFGIAKATMRPGATTSGALKGKLGYMAPEYVTSNALDARSDVFALGVVLWEALAGRKLFRGSNEIATLELVARCEVPRISEVRPEVGTALDDVLESALAKDPEQRF
ncbi:MAG: serine/threonine protein kinase, partial [Myxococcales bacterium]|nr:serine/threonine protein kinase [Myxococcales bacterium]